MRRYRRLLAWAAAAAVLALVFASYTQRDFVFDLANRAWACF